MDNKINWKQKLASRKFWALLGALATAVMAGVVSPDTTAKVTGIITAVGACACYMLTEASVDKYRGNDAAAGDSGDSEDDADK